MPLYYRPANIVDAEETLEDAALFNALHAEFGKGLTVLGRDKDIPEDGPFIGRTRSMEFPGNLFLKGETDYWTDPAFLKHAGREFSFCDLSEAEDAVADLHARGKAAVVKSSRDKYFIDTIKPGTTLNRALGSMVYTFCDAGKCLMVQEHVPMRFEHRFLVIGRKVATHSPNAYSLTPMSPVYGGFTGKITDNHFETPKSTKPIHNPELTKAMLHMAESIAKEAIEPNLCIDLALTDTGVVCVEFNPMHVGMVGLFACNPKDLVSAIADTMEPELLAEVREQQHAPEEDPYAMMYDDFDEEDFDEGDFEGGIICE